MKQTSPVANGNIRTAYLAYLNTCGILTTQLSVDTQLQATFDDSKAKERLTFTAIDFETKQLITFTPGGSFQQYTLHRAA